MNLIGVNHWTQQYFCLDLKRPILFFVLHPKNFSKAEAIAP